MNKLYLISQDINTGYDTYDACVVCAESVAAAKLTHPWKDDWDGKGEKYEEWCAVEDVQVELIGTAEEKQEVGLLLVSFNAG